MQPNIINILHDGSLNEENLPKCGPETEFKVSLWPSESLPDANEKVLVYLVSAPPGHEDLVTLETTSLPRTTGFSLPDPLNDDPGGIGTSKIVVSCGSSTAETTVNIINPNAKITSSSGANWTGFVNALNTFLHAIPGTPCSATSTVNVTTTIERKICNCGPGVKTTHQVSVGGSFGCSTNIPAGGGVIYVPVGFSGGIQGSVNGVKECDDDTDICVEGQASFSASAGVAACLGSCDYISISAYITGGATMGATYCLDAGLSTQPPQGTISLGVQATTFGLTVASFNVPIYP